MRMVRDGREGERGGNDERTKTNVLGSMRQGAAR